MFMFIGFVLSESLQAEVGSVPAAPNPDTSGAVSWYNREHIVVQMPVAYIAASPGRIT